MVDLWTKIWPTMETFSHVAVIFMMVFAVHGMVRLMRFAIRPVYRKKCLARIKSGLIYWWSVSPQPWFWLCLWSLYQFHPVNFQWLISIYAVITLIFWVPRIYTLANCWNTYETSGTSVAARNHHAFLVAVKPACPHRDLSFYSGIRLVADLAGLVWLTLGHYWVWFTIVLIVMLIKILGMFSLNLTAEEMTMAEARLGAAYKASLQHLTGQEKRQTRPNTLVKPGEED